MHVDRHDLHRFEVIHGEPQLPAQEAERAARDMAADADARILAERHDDAPPLEQRLVGIADGGAGLDLDRAPPRVPGDAPHRRQIDDHARVRVGDETLEAVAAARGHQPPASPHGFVHRRDDLRRRADRAHVVGAGPEALVDLAIQHGAIARVVRRESFSGVVRLIGGWAFRSWPSTIFPHFVTGD